MTLSVVSHLRPLNLSYWLRLLGFFVLTLVIALISLPVLLGALVTLGLLYAPCLDSHPTPADYGYEWEDITIQARAGGSFRGYFIPGTNGAAIIIPPTGSSSHNARLPEAVVLLRHGYSVFTFESRLCAKMGSLSLGYREVDEVADVLNYLLKRQDVDPERIGIKGFSTAGATAIMATARLPALRAVVAEGGYGDFAKNALDPGPSSGLTAYFWALYHWSTRLIYRLATGLDIDSLSPVSAIGDIAPRPILLIYGSQERSLPAGRQQKVAAGDNAELWIVPGAGHGNYLNVAPEEYEARVVAFFDEALK